MTVTMRTDSAERTADRQTVRDRLDNADFSWFVVASLPHQEKKLASMLMKYREESGNLLEVYCPTHTTVKVERNGKRECRPLLAGRVFVLSTEQVIVNFIEKHYPDGFILYDRRDTASGKARYLTIPEPQMRLFKDFNENYAEQAVILERPYTDYAFNPKTNEPNDIVKVIDGPLAGHKGYLVRFGRSRGLVFNMETYGGRGHVAISIPDIWRFRVVRLHNAEGDRQAVGTVKERAVDLLIGIIESCGYGENTLPVLYEITGYLSATPTLTGLCKDLEKKGQSQLAQRLTRLGTKEASIVMNLMRYEHDNPGYVSANWKEQVMRPFLTPTSGVEMDDSQEETCLQHGGFTEIIRKVDVTEQAFYPSEGREEQTVTTYYAHVGIMPNGNGKGCTLFANWDAFLEKYFHTEGKANEKLLKGTTSFAAVKTGSERPDDKTIESFRNFAPTLYNILSDTASEVQAVKGFNAGGHTLNVLAIETAGTDAASIETAKEKLITTCVNACKEINSTARLAVWRRYLRTVWLHV